ncbi:MAG: UDP-3-O-(3-hydroxymyristoyl)glucosamine N-acyltransferase [Muribaculaceae bacterium]|nr:UDP-3-O-(3-hydroxymyristoyl)glucosamine N-acyltransferase [Muribaculaceae bacterium]
MEITARELAIIAGGRVDGDPDVKVNSFAKIEEAKTGDLSFIANPKYSHFAETTEASILLVSEDFIAPDNCCATLLRVKDPYSTLAALMRMVDSMRPKPRGVENPVFCADGVSIPDDAYVGAFAYIGKNVSLGKGVQIYPQVYIGEGVSIGEDTVLYAGVKIYAGCKIGSRCIIHSGTVIGADGFGFAPVDGHFEKIPQLGTVLIEDDVEIGANTTIDRATFGNTRIGKGTKLDNLIQVAHNVSIGENNVFASQTGIAGSTRFGNNNMVGGQCGFAGHISIGDYNEFGAQSGIPGNVGDRKRLIGYPAVDSRQWARTNVYIKKLPELFAADKHREK